MRHCDYENTMKLLLVLLLVGYLLAGDAGDHVQYMGGTISALPTKAEGFLNTRGEDLFLF
jgi:hypothetical protein